MLVKVRIVRFDFCIVCRRLVADRRVNLHKHKALTNLVDVQRVGFVFYKVYRRLAPFQKVCFDFINLCRRLLEG